MYSLMTLMKMKKRKHQTKNKLKNPSSLESGEG